MQDDRSEEPRGGTRRTFLKALAGQSAILLVAACSAPAPAAPTAAPKPAATTSAASAAKPATAASPAAAAAPTAAPASNAAKTKLSVALSNRSASGTGLYMAYESGLFAKQGLDVDLQFIASSTTISALIADQIYACLVAGSETMAAQIGGAELLIPVQLTARQSYLFMVAPEIKTLDDLRGKKIGVSQFGSSSDASTRMALRAKGLDPEKDVTIVAVGSLEARTAAMIGGAIQGGLGSPPDTIAVEKKGWHAIMDLSEMDLPPLLIIHAMRKATVNKDRDLAQRYVNALVEAASLTRKDKPAAIAALSKWLKLDDQDALNETYDYWVGHILKSPPSIDTSNWGPLVDEIAVTNPKAKDFNPDTMVDRSFVDNAVAAGLSA